MIKRRWVDDSTCQFYDERGNCKQFVLWVYCCESGVGDYGSVRWCK
jgi:hypothetical protein